MYKMHRIQSKTAQTGTCTQALFQTAAQRCKQKRRPPYNTIKRDLASGCWQCTNPGHCSRDKPCDSVKLLCCTDLCTEPLRTHNRTPVLPLVMAPSGTYTHVQHQHTAACWVPTASSQEMVVSEQLVLQHTPVTFIVWCSARLVCDVANASFHSL